MHVAAPTAAVPPAIDRTPLDSFAARPLVAFEYDGVERATWTVGSFLRRSEHFVAERPVRTRDMVHAMDHFTLPHAIMYADRVGAAVPDAPRDRFVPAGSSFEDALRMATDLSGGSLDARQPVAVVQAGEGRYFVTPLGYYDGDRPEIGTWTRPGDIAGEIVEGGEWSLTSGTVPPTSKVPSAEATRSLANGRLARIVPLHESVQALVDGTTWHDLRGGAAAVDDAGAGARQVAGG